MCRSCAEGSRRCPNDTSESRRLRRKNQKALETHKAVPVNRKYVSPQGTPTYLPQELLAEIGELKTLLSAPLLDSQEEQDKLDDAIESRVTAVGKTLALEAEKRSGFIKEKFIEAYNETSEEFDEAFMEFTEAEESMIAAQEALKEFNDDNLDLTEETKAKKEDLETTLEESKKVLAVAWSAYNAASAEDDRKRDLLHGEAMVKLTNAYKSIIAEVRPVGGTIQLNDEASSEGLKALNETIGKHYPTDWIEASNAQKDDMVLTLENQRAYYYHESQHTNLDVNEHPDKVKKVFASYLTIPVPVDELDKVKELLGDHAKIFDARPILINEDTCKIVETPEYVFFNESKPNLEPTSSTHGEGWKYSHYIDRTTHKVSAKKAWIRYVGEKAVVVKPEISLPTDLRSDPAVAYHEFAHRIESISTNGSIMRQEEAFLRRRTTNPDTGEREDNSFIYPMLPGSSIATAEIGRRNSFVVHYVGKEYITSHNREVLSVGIESIFGGNYSALNGLKDEYKADEDHKGFTLGILAVV